MSTFRLPSTAKTAPEYEDSGGTFDPQLHFTGDARDASEVKAIQAVLDRFGSGVVAYYDYAPSPGMFSLELHFGNDEDLSACRKAYEALFDEDGTLKPEHRK